MARSIGIQLIKAVISTGKALDRASRRAAREQERHRRAKEREVDRCSREAARWEREQAARDIRRQRKINADKKQQLRDFLEEGKAAYTARCAERAALRRNLLTQIFK